MTRFRTWLMAVAVLAVSGASVSAQTLPADQPSTQEKRVDVLERTPDFDQQVHDLKHAATRLPVAVALACILALRPRRRATPPRQAPVIQTQIILAVVGAVVMLVVGSSLARAFGIVGAAGLVRYRAKIEDPKDAGVMLSTLAVGLAAGVGVYLLATFATLFILAVLWFVESFEPKASVSFTLKVKAKDPMEFKPELEQVLAQHQVTFELRGTSAEELHYEVRVPIERKRERLAEAILAVDPENATAVDLEEKKDKK